MAMMIRFEMRMETRQRQAMECSGCGRLIQSKEMYEATSFRFVPGVGVVEDWPTMCRRVGACAVCGMDGLDDRAVLETIEVAKRLQSPKKNPQPRDLELEMRRLQDFLFYST